LEYTKCTQRNDTIIIIGKESPNIKTKNRKGGGIMGGKLKPSA
jgi:hypothetical protein